MKIFALSLERSRERNNYIRDHLAVVTRNPWEIVGIDGAELRARLPEWPHASHLTNAQVGCALSHLTACRRLVQQGWKSALIVEDDVVLPSDIDELLDFIGSTIRDSEVIAIYNRTMRKEEFSAYSKHSKGRFSLIYPFEARTMRTAAAYVIGRSAAKNIVEYNDPVRVVADNWDEFYKIGAIRYFRLVYPLPVHLKPFMSTLAPDRQSGFGWSIVLRFVNTALGRKLRSMRRMWIERRRERNIVVVDRPSVFAAEDAGTPERGG